MSPNVDKGERDTVPPTRVVDVVLSVSRPGMCVDGARILADGDSATAPKARSTSDVASWLVTNMCDPKRVFAWVGPTPCRQCVGGCSSCPSVSSTT